MADDGGDDVHPRHRGTAAARAAGGVPRSDHDPVPRRHRGRAGMALSRARRRWRFRDPDALRPGRTVGPGDGGRSRHPLPGRARARTTSTCTAGTSSPRGFPATRLRPGPRPLAAHAPPDPREVPRGDGRGAAPGRLAAGARTSTSSRSRPWPRVSTPRCGPRRRRRLRDRRHGDDVRPAAPGPLRPCRAQGRRADLRGARCTGAGTPFADVTSASFDQMRPLLLAAGATEDQLDELRPTS